MMSIFKITGFLSITIGVLCFDPVTSFKVKGPIVPQPEVFPSTSYNTYYNNYNYIPYVGDGTKCDSKQSCNTTSGLHCVDGMCACHYPGHQLYYNGSCVSMSRGPCRIQDKNVDIPCIANAECVEDALSVHSKCQCITGFVESPQRYCQIAYGQPCGQENMKGRPVGCDHLAHLACVEGTCQCLDQLHVYDEKEGVCRGEEGAICRFMEHRDCLEGLECKAGRNQNELNGMCGCLEGKKWNGKGCE